MHGLAGGHDPRAFAADTVSDRFFFFDAELSQIRDAGSRVTPLFPVTRPETTTDPLVHLAEKTFDWHQAEVPHPALEVAAQFLIPMLHRHAAIAAGDLADSVFELLHVLGAHANLTTVAFEHEAEPCSFLKQHGDSVCSADAALLAIDHQFQFSRQVSFHRLEHAGRRFLGFGEHQEVVRVTDKTQAPSFQFLVEVIQQDVRQQG